MAGARATVGEGVRVRVRLPLRSRWRIRAMFRGEIVELDVCWMSRARWLRDGAGGGAGGGEWVLLPVGPFVVALRLA